MIVGGRSINTARKGRGRSSGSERFPAVGFRGFGGRPSLLPVGFGGRPSLLPIGFGGRLSLSKRVCSR